MKKKLKIFLAVIFSLSLVFTLCACSSSSDETKEGEETTTEEETSPAENLYTLREDSKTLVVSLPTEPDSEKQWVYDISDTELIDVSGLTYESVTSESEEESETESEGEQSENWVVSFTTSDVNNGKVKIKFYYVNNADEKESIDPDYTFNLSIGLDQKITVESVMK